MKIGTKIDALLLVAAVVLPMTFGAAWFFSQQVHGKLADMAAAGIELHNVSRHITCGAIS